MFIISTKLRINLKPHGMLSSKSLLLPTISDKEKPMVSAGYVDLCLILVVDCSRILFFF